MSDNVLAYIRDGELEHAVSLSLLVYFTLSELKINLKTVNVKIDRGVNSGGNMSATSDGQQRGGL